MKIITLVLLLSSLSVNNKLQGIWKSTDINTIKYLNFKSDGKLLEIKSKETNRYYFSTKENFIQFKKVYKDASDSSYFRKMVKLYVLKMESYKA